jgi:EAL domain-containing protein (putative c-di-GMP-specific phosphodiesterase class I)/FixJ family two-component response regulator
MSVDTEQSVAWPSVARAFVLDDEPQIGALVCKVLHACGIASRQFTSPGPFLAELNELAADFVLLDLSLGQSDAVEIIRQLEAHKYPGKVILISGRDEETLQEITRIGQKHGLAMLPPLKKPFRPADLKERLSFQLAEVKSAKAPDVAKKAVPSTAKINVLDALGNGWLEVWYQPKIDVKTLAFCGAEALIRARHPTHGIITPDRLLPPRGDPDYQPLTQFIIERVVADWAQLAQRGVNLKLSINVPASVLYAPSFITLIRSLFPSDPQFPGLIVEITENEVIRDGERAREIATQLKLYNISLSIDDFGAGYASLSRLNDLAFTEIKIDRSFVSGCALDQLKHSLCRTVIDLAHRLGATVCAEGVETTEDLRELIGMRCDSAQGFLFAKPMLAAQLAAAALSGAPALRGAMQMSA